MCRLPGPTRLCPSPSTARRCRCQTLSSPGVPQPEGHPPAPLPILAERTSRVSPDPAPARTPEQGHPHGWHGLTFPEDTVHAIQGMGITGRSEKGRGQGPWLLSTAAALPLPPGTGGSRGGGPGSDPAAPGAGARAVPPVRCCPPAAPPGLPALCPSAPRHGPSLTCAAEPAAASRRSAS